MYPFTQLYHLFLLATAPSPLTAHFVRALLSPSLLSLTLTVDLAPL